MPLQVVIADDEVLARQKLLQLLREEPDIQVVGEGANAAETIDLVQLTQPDVLLLDVRMPGMDGFDVISALSCSSLQSLPSIIFTTAHDQYALKAFEVHAVDYLLKPVELGRLERAVARVGSLLAAPAAEAAPASPWSQEFWVPHRAELIRILARDIDLIEAERDYMRLHLGQRSYLLHQTIGELERRLDPKEFIRLHRSTIVRRERIAGFKRDGEGAWLAELADGRLLRVGRTYLQNARAMVER